MLKSSNWNFWINIISNISIFDAYKEFNSIFFSFDSENTNGTSNSNTNFDSLKKIILDLSSIECS